MDSLGSERGTVQPQSNSKEGGKHLCVCLISILSILPIFDVVSAKRFSLFLFERGRISRPVGPIFFFYSFFLIFD
jgi:hypothetical protein